MTNKRSKTENKGYRRFAAWIHTVINPILDGLEREISLLDQKNWTWRYYNQKLEFIHEIKKYIAYSDWPNYEQFIRTNKKAEKWFTEHDNLLQELTESTTKAHHILVQSEEFSEDVDSALKAFMEKEGVDPYGGAPRDKAISIIAEYVINNRAELPNQYTDSLFWRRKGQDILPYRQEPSLQPMFTTGEKLGLHDRKIHRELDDLRFEWGEKYDLPYAPHLVGVED